MTTARHKKRVAYKDALTWALVASLWTLCLSTVGTVMWQEAAYPLLPAERVEVQRLDEHSRMVVFLETIDPATGAGSRCSGFLVGPDVVATAAHCVVGKGRATLYPAAHRVGDGFVHPYGVCYSETFHVDPGYGRPDSTYEHDFAAVRVDDCAVSPENPTGRTDLGNLLGHFTLAAPSRSALDGATVVHLGYPGDKEPGTLMRTESVVRRVTCDMRLDLACRHRWGITSAMTTPGGSSGGVLYDPATGAAVGILDAWSPHQAESLFRRVDSGVLAMYRSWGAS